MESCVTVAVCNAASRRPGDSEIADGAYRRFRAARVRGGGAGCRAQAVRFWAHRWVGRRSRSRRFVLRASDRAGVPASGCRIDGSGVTASGGPMILAGDSCHEAM